MQEAVSSVPLMSRVSLADLSQNFASFHKIATGIYGNDSKAIFEVEGAGEDQWVSFYHQSQ